MSQTHHTFCRICGPQCGMVVETENNKILSITSDKSHPITKGYLCYKGVTTQDLHNGEGRLLRARKKNESGKQVDTDTHQALDEIHEKLEALVDKYGPECVGVYFGTGANTNALCQATLKMWHQLLDTPWLFSSMTIDQSAKWVTAARMGMFTTGMHSYHDIDVYLVAGANPLVSHAGAFTFKSWIKEAKAKGQKIIVVDPRKTEFARFADIHLQILPGTDVPVFAAILNEIFANGWENHEFCQRFVDSLETLRAAVRPYSVEKAAQIARDPADQIRKIAKWFSLAKRPAATSGTGPNMIRHSNLAEHLIQCLNVVTGAFRCAGTEIANTGVVFKDPLNQEMVVPPHRSWEEGPCLPATGGGKLFGEYPTSRLPDELLSADETSRIRALFVIGGNPISAIGQPEKTLKAFRNLDLLVTLDQAVTQTVELSDYAIPSSVQYEREDITCMFESTIYPKPFVQITKALLEKPEGVLHDWEFFWESARRLGKVLQVRRPQFGSSPVEGEPRMTLDMNNKPDTSDIIKWFCSLNDNDYEEILRHPSGMLIDKEPVTVAAADNCDAKLDACPNDIKEALHSFSCSEDFKQANGKPEEEAFPFRLSCRRFLETMNSQYAESSRTRKRYELNPVWINPNDMQAAGIEERQRVCVSSENGSLTALARADKTMKPGAVSISHMWGTRANSDPDDAQVGRLISIDQDLEAINFMPMYSGIPVALRKI